MVQVEEKSIENKKAFINEMFANIAEKYDLLNNLITFGMHNLWKKKAVSLALSEIDEPKYALDLCAGTGDLSIILKKNCPNIKITCVDNCLSMLKLAQNKFEKHNIFDIEPINLDCENLKLPGSSFDLITISFGLRNLINKPKALSSIYSLLKPCGVFTCLDLGFPKNILWQKVYYFYFFNLVPKLGQMFAQNKEAYTYLPSSLNAWYKQEDLKELILKTGFTRCYFKNILGGAIAIHIAIK